MTIRIVGNVPEIIRNTKIETELVALDDVLLSQLGVVVVINKYGEELDELLTKIHQSDMGWSWRVFVCNESTLSDSLSDGIVNSDWVEDESKHTQFAKLHRVAENPKDKLLAYLWLDESRQIRPIKFINHHDIYRYPLLDIYHNQEHTPFRYIHRLLEADLIEKKRCIDRVRYCQSCHSGHLNFVDTCPSCRSIDIETFDALHCFTCGHVDDSKAFLSRRSMSCPKCHTELKHIGVDYDRPLELYNCNDCYQEFVEPEVVASCMSCDHVNATSDLSAKSFYSFKSGENLQRYLLDQNIESRRSVLLSGTVTSEVFEAALGWKNQLSIRHKHQDLLIGIKIHNVSSYIERHGDVAFIEFVSNFSEQLDSLFRTTDLSCQFSDDVVFVLLPHCDSNFVSIIQDRVQGFADKIDTELLALTVNSWILPSHNMKEVSNWLRERVSELDD